ncbi:3-keto-disaccharide hydrolase [Haloferula rosea]|uniref:DUF1080 domain-containing protein n=1 Tax=Haloferula rosea TaxID=490093 RepID=A0A934RC95_9BACT|nr:DUF1080 domain-containing protein [Haloferula rosea]MBK1828974.1 DUF1080 domain-containing protein [Haloferula rosea]
MKNLILLVSLAVAVSLTSSAAPITDPDQLDWIKGKFKKDAAASIEKLEQLPINTDPEPDLTAGFTSLYKGDGDLSGWTVLGGHHTFEASGEVITGTCVKGSRNAFLSTTRRDYQDFVFTVEMKWEVEGNTGVMFRAQTKPGKKIGESVVFGPQVEMESPSQGRGWSGGIYGEKAGGWHYPLVLDAHKAARKAIVPDRWNRVTVMAKGNSIKTWINGVPAAHWKSAEHMKGFFGLQIHSGKAGTVLFRNIRVKEL